MALFLVASISRLFRGSAWLQGALLSRLFPLVTTFR